MNCETCAWSLLFGEDEICIAEAIWVPSVGSKDCQHWMPSSFDNRKKYVDEWHKSKDRDRLVNRHWESLVGPIDELENE